MTMKRLFLSVLCAVPAFCIGQAVLLYNDGATVKVQAGATLYVEGGIQNTATGTIDNDGIIEVKGNFINAGTWEPSQPNTLKFSGNVNSDVTPGSAQFQTVVIQKDPTFNVNLLGRMTVNTNLDFNATGASKIILGNNDLRMGASATITGYDGDEYIVTGGTGRMRKTYASAGSFVFPVGFDASTYNPATINVTSGPADTISTRVLASPTTGNGTTGTPITTDVVNAVWDIQEKVPGGNVFDVTLGWSQSDQLPGFDEALNAVSRNDGTNGWDGLFADLGPEVSNTRTKTGYTGGGAFTVGDKTVANTLYVNAKVFLQGPYINASGLMVDSLRKNNYIPLTEPYSTLPSNPYVHKAYGGGETVSSSAVFNQPADGDDIVDWIVVELRNTTTNILATKSALLQRDGDIVDLDGLSPLTVLGAGDGSYYLGLRHRNHLGVRSNSTVALSNTVPSITDFSVNGIAFDDPAITKPTIPMKLLTGAIYGLWSGDATFNGDISFNGGGNDKNVVLAAVGGSAGSNNVIPGYNRADVNMNGTTSFNGANNDKNVILANVTSADINTPLTAHNNN